MTELPSALMLLLFILPVVPELITIMRTFAFVLHTLSLAIILLILGCGSENSSEYRTLAEPRSPLILIKGLGNHQIFLRSHGMPHSVAPVYSLVSRSKLYSPMKIETPVVVTDLDPLSSALIERAFTVELVKSQYGLTQVYLRFDTKHNGGSNPQGSDLNKILLGETSFQSAVATTQYPSALSKPQTSISSQAGVEAVFPNPSPQANQVTTNPIQPGRTRIPSVKPSSTQESLVLPSPKLRFDILKKQQNEFVTINLATGFPYKEQIIEPFACTNRSCPLLSIETTCDNNILKCLPQTKNKPVDVQSSNLVQLNTGAFIADFPPGQNTIGRLRFTAPSIPANSFENQQLCESSVNYLVRDSFTGRSQPNCHLSRIAALDPHNGKLSCQVEVSFSSPSHLFQYGCTVTAIFALEGKPKEIKQADVFMKLH